MSPSRIVLAASAGAALAVAVRAQTDGWQRVDVPEPTPVLAVEQPGGDRIEVRDGVVVRSRGSETAALECTAPVGTVRALCDSPAGLVFVATSTGLFVAHRSVATLDPVELGDGAPAGPPIGVASDRLDRVWLVTEREVGCVHQGFWFGRVHGERDGLPPPPYRSLALDDDGRLLLSAAAGVFAYRPDPAPPVLRTAEPVSDPTGPGVVAFRLDGDGAGGATFRYRHRNHHLMRDLSSRAIEFEKPGGQQLMIHAYDRDLDASPPAAVDIRVPYPPQLDKRVLLAGAVSLGALVLFVFWRRGRARGTGWPRAALETALLLMVLLQIGAAIAGVGRSYPFIAFSMYREVYHESDVLFTPSILLASDDGEPVESSGGVFGFATDGIWRHLVRWLYSDAADRDVLRRELQPGVRCVELRVRRCRLTAAGPRDVAPWVLGRYRWPEEPR